MALLHPDSRICAVGPPTVLFRKHAGSVTTAISPENYDHHITLYLGMDIRLSEKAEELSPGALELIRRKFMPYKFIQNLNIVRKETATRDQFSADGKRAAPEYGFENYSRAPSTRPPDIAAYDLL